MNIAKETAKLSYCNRLKVGAIIVKGNSILSYGYNGTPPGFENVCESDTNETFEYVLHAEENALMKVANSNESLKDSVMFLTHAPCVKCSKLISVTDIKIIIYDELYRDTKGISLLKSVGKHIYCIKELIA